MLPLFVACDDDSTESNPEPTPTNDAEVRSTIGPDGGELVGKQGTELEGVKLTIPAGALASDVDVWIRPTFDGDALPELSERVGLQVEVGSDGELTEPAELTLPFDPGVVARFGDEGDAVKVWVKGEGSGWSLVEADDATDADVTIALEQFTTAAAGVKVLGLPAFCGTSCDPSAAAHFDAGGCAASGACITALDTTSLPETFDFAASADGLGYLSTSGIGVIAVSHQISDGTSNASPVQAVGTSARLGVAFGGTTLFAGLGSAGNVAFAGSAKPAVFDAGAGLGVVTTKSGTPIRLSRAANGNLTAINHTTGKALKVPALPIPSLTNGNVASIVSPRDPASIMVIAVTHVVELKLSANGETLTETARIELPSSLQTSGSKLLKVSDKIMVIAVLVGGKVAVSRDAGAFELLDLDFPASSVAVDDLGRVLVGAAKSPELALFEQSGLPTGVRLSDAATTSTEFTGRIPRAIQPLGERFAVLAQDRSFYVVEL